MRHGRAALAVALLAAAVYAAAGHASRSDEPPNPALRDCRSRAEGRAPIEMKVTRNDVRIGPLVLGNVRAADVGQTDDPDWPYAKKTPVLLEARSRVVLAIAPGASSIATLQHRNDWVPAVRFHACFERVRAFAYDGTVGPTTFFPFGIGLRQRSACVPIQLWIDGRSTPTRRVVPVGRRTC